MKANAKNTTRRDFLRSTGTALAVSTVAAVPAIATAQPSTLAVLWAERSALWDEQREHWTKFMAGRAATDAHHSLEVLPGVKMPDGRKVTVLNFDTIFHHALECERGAHMLHADWYAAALDLTKDVTEKLWQQSRERHAERDRIEAENGTTDAYSRASDLTAKVIEIDDRIAATPAASFADLAVKARLLAEWRAEWHEDGSNMARVYTPAEGEEPDDYNRLLASMAADAERLAKNA